MTRAAARHTQQALAAQALGLTRLLRERFTAEQLEAELRGILAVLHLDEPDKVNEKMGKIGQAAGGNDAALRSMYGAQIAQANPLYAQELTERWRPPPAG